ncbi:MAG: hypothetical protein EWM45_01205 [Rhodopseudomonas palustris]|nr:MAG: hypothetical protein EWM45_01205 [Rhodopseudomonas palustris]
METRITEADQATTLKDAIIAIPALASALAITFNVGYFAGIDISFLTVFSLPEHLVFSLEAIPYALLLAGTLWWTLSYGYVDSLIRLAQSHPKPKLQLRVSIGIQIVTTLTLVFLMTHLFGGIAGFAIGLSLGVSMAAGFLVADTRTMKRRRMDVLVASFLLAEVFALSFGMLFSRIFLLKPGIALQQIQMEGELIQGQIIRTGDRGILYFDPKEKRTNLIPWSRVKSVSSSL